MRKLHILVEGQTEEVIVNNVIGPYLSNEDLYVTPSILETKPPAGGRPAHTGGVSSWTKILREIRLLLGDTSTTMLTTLIDYYGFPDDAPGMADRPIGSPHARVEHVESALADAVDSRRFLPHLVMHEIKAWVLADCPRLADLLGNSSEAARLAQMVATESGPEMVNDGIDTAPSKRIKGIYPKYGKTLDGPLVIARLRMRTFEPRDTAWWTLAASVPQADIDYGTWSSRYGNPHAYPPLGSAVAGYGWVAVTFRIWPICTWIRVRPTR